ncbi:MAG: protocatechuate 3,4-dioxygenase subunit beta [Geminicoccaceae bacterium]
MKNIREDWTSAFQPRDRAMQPPALSPGYKTSVLRSPRQALLSLVPTLSELTGPVFTSDDVDPLDNDLIANSAQSGDPIGERLVVHGRVTDDAGRPVPHSLVEIWQCNAAGRYRHVKDGYLAPIDPNFSGFGRCLTDADGHYRFRTIKPGPYPWRNRANDWRPAHIHFSLFGPAFATRLITQMYFAGDPLIPHCPILGSVPDKAAIERLVAPFDFSASQPFDCLAYRFDIVLRGRRQTWFENRPEGG